MVIWSSSRENLHTSVTLPVVSIVAISRMHARSVLRHQLPELSVQLSRLASVPKVLSILLLTEIGGESEILGFSLGSSTSSPAFLIPAIFPRTSVTYFLCASKRPSSLTAER
jgi:hypothetical protein